jgi:16S rRNA (cytosine1402-N4)-methyltransferase
MRRMHVEAFRRHEPVLLEAVLSHLNLHPGSVVVDGTVGSGGHAEAILSQIGPDGLLVGIDQDTEALERTRKRLEVIKGKFILHHSNFLHIDKVLTSLNLSRIDAVLLDIGLSTEHLGDDSRGFSLKNDGPLDMRMDQHENRETAGDILKRFSEDELTGIFRLYGEERHAKSIAREIARVRKKKALTTTRELRELIESLTPKRSLHGRIHPATRVFQALRISVNHELEVLEGALPKAFERMSQGARLAVISFHSLEDRIVKRFFVARKQAGEARILTKKPVQANEQERESNPRSRSAKLRVLERVMS